MLVVLCGKTASGKSSTAKKLEACGYQKLITDTSRPKRPGEVDGVDYHFQTEQEFLARKEAGDYAETMHLDTIYGPWYYGSRKECYKDIGQDRVIVLNPQGIKQVIQSVDPDHFVSIYLDLDESLLLKRLETRGDDPDEARWRLLADRIDFKGIEHYTDHQIKVDEKTSVDEVICEILRCTKKEALV